MRQNGISKYRNRKTVVNGMEFDSQLEAARYFDLCLLQKSGMISGLERQKKFILAGSKKLSSGKTERACAYVADFVYTDKDGKTVVEDTKGFRTKEYIVKRKWMLDKFGIEIREIS